MKKNFLILLISLILLSCGSSKRIIYLLNDRSQTNQVDTSAATLKVGDLLTITVNAISPDIAAPFNLPVIPTPYAINTVNPLASTSIALQNYLIDNDGNIIFPVLGKINAAGMTKDQLAVYIKNQIYPHYIKEPPIVNIRYLNYKISVLGEVLRPGLYTIDNEHINILEAIALAGDLTIYGKRDHVLIIRENNRQSKTIYYLDLTDKKLINSSLYYLHPNDIIYIRPNKPKVRSSSFNVAESISISIVGSLISLASFLTLLLRK